MTIDELIVRLRIEEDNKTAQKSARVEPMAKANMVELGQSSKGGHKGKGKMDKGKGKVNLGPKKEVVKKKPQSSNFQGVCYNCKENGHRANQCKKPKRERAHMVDENGEPLVAMITELSAMIEEINLVGDKPQGWFNDTGATRHAVIRCNVLIVGDKLTGKTTFNEHISCDDNYVVSGGYTSAVTRLKTSIGQVSLYTYDVDVIPHEFDIRYIPDNFFVGLPVDIAIIMCDTTKRSTYIGIHYWRNAIKERSPNCPIVVCGNKVDQPRYCPASDMRSMISPQPYFEISAEANYNLQKILLRLIRIHRGDNTIEFVEAPRLGLPPEPGVVVNTELQARHEAEYEASVAREAARRHGL
ncbi:GTP-binding nuclear protein Ran1B-like [Bidens hawaiensis]|uniref:GTP-binding nuclear protein Ran1B-like n=1 Tax=Bidens hawaiensis TaxID=980011 RepID=UPI00404B82AA